MSATTKALINALGAAALAVIALSGCAEYGAIMACGGRVKASQRITAWTEIAPIALGSGPCDVRYACNGRIIITRPNQQPKDYGQGVVSVYPAR